MPPLSAAGFRRGREEKSIESDGEVLREGETR